MLPPLPFYVFAGLCFICYFCVSTHEHWDWNQWEQFKLFAPMAVVVWLVPVALGAFASLSFRSQMLAIVTTFIGMYPFIMWGALGILWFGCNPLWTTLPICFAFLVVSRMRAWYWLREKLNWRTRLYTLYPVFGTILAILIALPFVRVYSVPYISWEQVNTYRYYSPEERQALNKAATEELLAHREFQDNLVGQWIICSPSERARRDRILRIQLVALLDSQPSGFGSECRRFVKKLESRNALFDQWNM
jgi:hypothetical protein